jgi:hypothetical protein
MWEAKPGNVFESQGYHGSTQQRIRTPRSTSMHGSESRGEASRAAIMQCCNSYERANEPREVRIYLRASLVVNVGPIDFGAAIVK